MSLSHLENYDLQELLLSKTNSILTRNNALDASVSNIDNVL
jgi:hypothetical protein